MTKFINQQRHTTQTGGVQTSAAYALDVLLYLLSNKSTLYILSWAQPYGLSVLKEKIHSAFMHMDAHGIQHDSFLGNSLIKVHKFMRTPTFKSLRETVCHLRSVFGLYVLHWRQNSRTRATIRRAQSLEFDGSFSVFSGSFFPPHTAHPIGL
jgi:hypothetical protein